MKMDTKFYGDIYKAKDHTRVPDDEYVVFLVKDNAFGAMLPVYHSICVQLGCDPEHLASVQALIDRVARWRSQHPELCKNPDAAGERLLSSE